MRRIIAATVAVLAGLALMGGTTEATAPTQLAVQIVPTRHANKTGRSIDTGRHFHVVVTNLSDRPLGLWRDWCSWGYFNLSFIAVDEDGRSIAVTKEARGWDKNFPDSMLIPPGEHMVFDVSFHDPVWQNAPLPKQGQSRSIKLRAVYTIAADEEAKEFGVWTGRVSSPTNTYTLW